MKKKDGTFKALQHKQICDCRF